MGKIYCLVGKSASGKDSLFEKLLERVPSLRPIIQYTTRPMRDFEQEGVEYHFIDRARYSKLEEQGKVIESRDYHTVLGIWIYATVDDGQVDLAKGDYLSTGTISSYLSYCSHFGDDVVVPLYIEVEDGERLIRAIRREQEREKPQYEEMCRRFLTDQEDFSEERIREAGITRRFANIDFEACLSEISAFIRSHL